MKAQADIVRLVATLLVLQFMRVNKLEEGELLRTLFSLEEPALFRSELKTRNRTEISLENSATKL